MEGIRGGAGIMNLDPENIHLYFLLTSDCEVAFPSLAREVTRLE